MGWEGLRDLRITQKLWDLCTSQVNLMPQRRSMNSWVWSQGCLMQMRAARSAYVCITGEMMEAIITKQTQSNALKMISKLLVIFYSAKKQIVLISKKIFLRKGTKECHFIRRSQILLYNYFPFLLLFFFFWERMVYNNYSYFKISWNQLD